MNEPSDATRDEPLYADVGTTGRRVAFRRVPGLEPTVVWLGGYRSDMRGTKAERVEAFARNAGIGSLRFDYSGHGESSGRFVDGTISQWRDDALAAIEAAAPQGRLVLVGSSMGAWIALLLAPRLRGRLSGIMLLAPAPDFTERLLLPSLNAEQRAALETTGIHAEPSGYSAEPNLFTQALVADGRRNLVMNEPIATGCPVHIIQGMADPDVPYAHALELVSCLSGDGIALTLVPGGDHRLSREEDLRRMENGLRDLIEAPRGD